MVLAVARRRVRWQERFEEGARMIAEGFGAYRHAHLRLPAAFIRAGTRFT